MERKAIAGDPPDDPEEIIDGMRPSEHLEHAYVEDANNILDEMLEVVNLEREESEQLEYYIERRAELWTEVYNQYLRWMGAELRVNIYFEDGVIQVE